MARRIYLHLYQIQSGTNTNCTFMFLDQDLLRSLKYLGWYWDILRNENSLNLLINDAILASKTTFLLISNLDNKLAKIKALSRDHHSGVF